jgi:carbon monoxide dehydrogenase subunit G
MTTFESSTIINKPVHEVYQFLADMNNHQQLMPDNIINWSSTVDEASFNIPNMVKLVLRIKERITDSEIKIFPVQQPPFNLDLKWVLTPSGQQTEVLFAINADLNIMMKTLASRPLQKLVDEEIANLASLLN